MNPVEIARLAKAILESPKYRGLDLCAETVHDLLARELPLHRSQKDAVKAVRKKLHNVVAPYLGDPDYAEMADQLERAFQEGRSRETCSLILSSHASTRERLEILDEFYPRLFDLTGTPQSILDLACGLNPFTFPWMFSASGTVSSASGTVSSASGTVSSARVQYHAYDIHKPRVQLINRFFELQGLAPLAEVRDILIHPPEIAADVAFFFKEAHRFEQRQRGCNRAFWQALRVRWLLVSLPPASLTGRHSLIDSQRRLLYDNLSGLNWPVTEMLFENELVFCIRKPEEDRS